MSEHRCRDEGYLVGPNEWYPSAPEDYHFFPLGPRIGCTNLVCTACGDVVTATVAGRTRDYSCRCNGVEGGPPGLRLKVAVVSPMTAYAPTADESIRPATVWRCGGHPIVTLPQTIAGEVVHDDLDGWVDRVAHGQVVVSYHPTVDGVTGFVAQRLYHVLDGDERTRLGAAIVAGLTGDVARAELALRFFLIAIESPWDDVLLAHEPRALAWADAGLAGDEARRKLYLRWLDAVGWRLSEDAPEGSIAARARDILRAHAQRAPGIGGQVYKLKMVDAAWVASQANLR